MEETIALLREQSGRSIDKGQPLTRLAFGLGILLLLVYAAFPTRNHYWDGIGFALNIEGAAQGESELADPMGGTQIYFNPNHLLHNLLGYVVYVPVHKLFPAVRALDVLVRVNMLLSAIAAMLVFLMLARWSGDLRLSLWLTLLMSFSATWWKFSTDANAYVPGVFLLVACTFLLSDPLRRPPVALIGLLHAAGILVHQISVLFFPAAVLAIWTHSYWCSGREKRKAAAVYTLVAGVAVIAAYLWVWFGVLNREWSPSAFLTWITYNGNEVYAYRSAVSNVLESLRSSMKVFFGGRISLALKIVEVPVLALGLAAMLAALAYLVAGIRKMRAEPSRIELSSLDQRFSRKFLYAWTGGFFVFLFFWLTEYPYYRLFCLPALVLLLAVQVKQHPLAMNPMKAFIIFLVAFNFTFMIYPYSKVESTQPVKLASEARAIWKSNVVVLYKESTCDNWIMQYFNPQTNWRLVDFTNLDQVAHDIREAFQNGQSVWLDTSVLGQLESSPELLRWLQGHAAMSKAWGISNARHHIQFTELLPL